MKRLRWSVLTALLVLVAAAAWAATRGQPIRTDGLHDPNSPAVGVLQEPPEAFANLPEDAVGNRVRWMRALDEGLITPRTNIQPETKVNLRFTEVLLKNTGEMPMVRFPHRQHTAWLDCSNCHDHLFEKTAGRTKINMFMILAGEKCGLCHGAVAFPLTECIRCHSAPRDGPDAAAFGSSLVREVVR